MEEQEINLLDLFGVLIRRRKIMYCVFIVVFIIAGMRAMLQKPVYESKVTVLITPSKLQAFFSQNKLSLVDLQGKITDIKSTFSMDTHIAFMKSSIVMEGIISQLKLKGTTPSSLLEKLKVEKNGSDSVLYMISRAGLPQLAQDIANVWVKQYIKLVADTMSNETKGTSNLIVSQFNLTKEELRKNESRLARFDNEVNLDFKRKNFEILESKLLEAKKRLLELKNELQAKQTLIQELGLELGKQEKFIVLSKAIDDEALWSNVAREGKQKEQLEKYKLQTEQINPIYLDLEGKLVAARTDLKVKEVELSYYGSQVEDLQKQVNKLGETINDKSLAYNELVREIQDKKETYKEIYAKSEEARIAESIVLGEIKIISPAYLSLGPINSRRRDLLVGAAIALILGVLSAFLQEFIDKVKGGLK